MMRPMRKAVPGTQNCSAPLSNIGRLIKDNYIMSAFEEYPPKNLDTKFVVHAHFRKETSVHLDIRIQYNEASLIGYTLTNPFSVERPFESFSNAKKIIEEKRPSLEKRIANPNDKFLAIPKEVQPAVWLKVEGEVREGEIGATQFGKGAFVIIDSGSVEFGRLATFFREYWFHGKLFNGRFVARLVPNSSIDNPDVEGGSSKTSLMWLFWKTKDQDPFVLSKRAITQGYIPPYDVSAMPKSLTAEIPSKLRFWHSKNKFKRIAIRSALVESGIIKLEEPSLSVADMTTETPDEKGAFSIIVKSFKGQFVIRFGPSRTIFHLFLSPDEKESSRHFVTITDPVKTSDVIAFVQYNNVKKILSKGIVPRGTYFNTTKDTDSFAEPLANGKYEMWRTELGYSLLRFASNKFSGVFKLRHETKDSDIILLEPVI